MELQYSLASFSLFMILGRNVCPLFLKYVPGYSSLTTNVKQQWNERVASSIHALFVTVQCVYLLAFEESIKTNVVLGYSRLAEFALAVAVGYFASDLVKVLMTFTRESDGDKIGFIIHHIVSIWAFCLTLNHRLLFYFAICRLLAEVSTPFVNLRWILFISGYKTSKLYFYNGCMMTASFFVSRILVMPLFYYKIVEVIYLEGNAHLINSVILHSLVVICVILDALNIIWFKKMLEGILKHFNSNLPKKAV